MTDKTLSYQCNHRGSCCHIPKNDIWPLYPSDIHRLAHHELSTFHLFDVSKTVSLMVLPHNQHFIGMFANPNKLASKRFDFYRCPSATSHPDMMYCNDYDYRPMRCKIFPYFPPEPKTEAEGISQWFTPLEQWAPEMSLWNSCFTQFEDLTTDMVSEPIAYNLAKWLTLNNIDIKTRNEEFEYLHKLNLEVEKHNLSKDQVIRIASATYHLDLYTAIENGFGHKPEMIPAVIETLIDLRPQNIKEIYARSMRVLEEEINRISEVKQTSTTYI